MRLFVLVCLSLVTNSVVLAGVVQEHDSFYLERNGREYFCQATAPVDPRDPNDSVECAQKAYSGPFSREESMKLWEGARNIFPAECGIDAYSGPFSREEAVRLCRGATSSLGPSQCAKAAYAGPFNRDEAVQLCARSGTIAHADCAKKAYSGPYSKEESIRLCRAEPGAMLKTLKRLAAFGQSKEKLK